MKTFSSLLFNKLKKTSEENNCNKHFDKESEFDQNSEKNSEMCFWKKDKL